jgi:hypothetical protein
MWRALADLTVVVHLGFVAFVVFGGLLALRWRAVAWAHLPAAGWATVAHLRGWVCPLTPFENWLRRKAGERGYEGSFVERYLLGVLYPSWLHRPSAMALGVVVLIITVATYGLVWWHFRREKRG